MMDGDLNHYKSTAVSLVFTLVFTLTTANLTTSQNSDKILLSDVKALTLYDGRMTTSRRTGAVPQLKCVGGSAQCRVTPNTVQCTNSGSDGSSIQWECKTVMDKAYRLGKIHVTCEGYDYPNDPYVLKGSCGLEYSVELTGGGGGGGPHTHSHYQQGDTKKIIASGIILLIGLVIFSCLIYACIQACNNSRTPAYAPNYMPNQGPPPPAYDSYGNPIYGAPPGYYPRPGYSNSYGGGGFGGGGYGGGGIGGGGFLTGAATGGVLGYMVGRSMSSDDHIGRCNSGGWGGGGGGGFSPSPGFDGSGSRMTSGFGETSGR